MWLKVVIVFLFIALVTSLFSSFGFLMKNRGKDPDDHRAWHSLTVRLILAALMIGFIFFGIYTGRLGSNAPWDARYATPPASETEAVQ